MILSWFLFILVLLYIAAIALGSKVLSGLGTPPSTLRDYLITAPKLAITLIRTRI